MALAFVVFVTYLLLRWPLDATEQAEVLGSLISLLGTIVGFYYGGRGSRR